MHEVQRLASGVVSRVLGGRSLNAELAALERRHAALSPQQRAALQDLCFGSLRFLGRLDAMLAALLDKPVRDAEVMSLLRVALYQLEYTKAPEHAVVDHAVRACKQIGSRAAQGLVNAVLRNFLRRREALAAHARRSEVGRFSFPQWWIDKLREQYPERYATMLETANLHPPLTLRINRRRTTLSDYLSQLGRHGIAAEQVGEAALMLEKARPVAAIPGFGEGLVSVQDAAAQCAAPLLDVHPHQVVLDACAAPGGKAAHILELADVELTALDIDAARLERVRANLDRLGLSARMVCGDAAQPSAWWDGRRFDRILADVPCSASGVVRRHPDIKWLRRPTDIAQFANVQSAMLDALWQLLATGGKLLYATCSVFHEENQQQIARFLERHHDARRLTLGLGFQLQDLPGQIIPDEKHDGFFYALLEKN